MGGQEMAAWGGQEMGAWVVRRGERGWSGEGSVDGQEMRAWVVRRWERGRSGDERAWMARLSHNQILHRPQRHTTLPQKLIH